MKPIEINRFKIEDSEEMGIPVLTVYWTWLGPGSRTLLPKVKDLGFGRNETSVIPVRADHGLRYWSRFGKGTHIKLSKPVLKAIKRLIDCHLVKTDKLRSNK